MSDMKDRVTQVILAEADVKKGFIPDHAKNKFSDNSGKLKCPFCQQELGTGSYYVHCHNPHCNTTVEMEGTEELWQELIKLMEENKRTRKALDVAVKRLGYIKNNYKSWTPDRDDQMIAQAANGLAEIKTALEQKE